MRTDASGRYRSGAAKMGQSNKSSDLPAHHFSFWSDFFFFFVLKKNDLTNVVLNLSIDT